MEKKDIVNFLKNTRNLDGDGTIYLTHLSTYITQSDKSIFEELNSFHQYSFDDIILIILELTVTEMLLSFKQMMILWEEIKHVDYGYFEEHLKLSIVSFYTMEHLFTLCQENMSSIAIQQIINNFWETISY